MRRMGIIECARRHASETYHGGEPLLFCGTTRVPLCATVRTRQAACRLLQDFFAASGGALLRKAHWPCRFRSKCPGRQSAKWLSHHRPNPLDACHVVGIRDRGRVVSGLWKSHGLLPADGSELAVT